MQTEAGMVAGAIGYEQFCDHLVRERALSPRTADKHVHHLRLAAAWCDCEPAAITFEGICRCLRETAVAKPPLSNVTRVQIIAAVQAYAWFLVSMGVAKAEVAERFSAIHVPTEAETRATVERKVAEVEEAGGEEAWLAKHRKPRLPRGEGWPRGTLDRYRKRARGVA